MGSSWGCFATPTLTEAAARAAGNRAAEIAKASATVPGPKLELADVPTIAAEWANDVREDPIGVSLARKGDLLVGVTKTMQDTGADLATAMYSIWDTAKWFAASQASRIND